MNAINKGENCVIAKNAEFGNNISLGHNCIIEEDVTIGDDVFIDSNTVIRKGVRLGKGSFVGSGCIIGEYWNEFCRNRNDDIHELKIGDNALIRSGTIIYGGSVIGDNFQTGHQVNIREKIHIGNNVSVGTLSDVQGNCVIGNFVRMHSNVHIGQLSQVDDYVWIFPYAVLTNDPLPPSNDLVGVHIEQFAVIATSAIIMAGVEVGAESLIGAGAIVTKPVEAFSVVAGNPAKKINDVRNIKNKTTGELYYPWREHFTNHMPWDKIGYEAWVLQTKETGLASD